MRAGQVARSRRRYQGAQSDWRQMRQDEREWVQGKVGMLAEAEALMWSQRQAAMMPLPEQPTP